MRSPKFCSLSDTRSPVPTPKLSPITERLTKLGATVQVGHRAENVAGAKAVVVTSALDPANPEVAEARRLQIPVIPRGELLAELMRLKFGIAIAGSHGKTTTTSMVASILNTANLDPTVVVGGRVAAMQGSNARVGKSSILVVESDESDGSFLKLAPILAVVTNIDREHLDHYASLDEIQGGIHRFREQGSVLWRGRSVHGRCQHPADLPRHPPPDDHLRPLRAS